MIPDDPIRHVIVLMMENRSFDQMLGGLAPAIAGLDGVPAAGPPRVNKDASGQVYPQAPGAARTFGFDPKHELADVLAQLAGGNAGFVEDFARAYPRSTPAERAEIMKYFAEGALPSLHALAKSFAVCDRWFASVPGPTWPNRLFVHSGTSLGRVSMPKGLIDANFHWYDQTTVFDRLNEKGIAWRIYYGDIPQSLILVHQLEPENARNYVKLNRFFADVGGEESGFPAYCFIEPPYYQPGAADDHPPHDVMEGERLIAEVYNALRRNEALWRSSLLVLLYDEHGGFYDHVSPPPAVAPDHHAEEYDFTRLGARVPALLVSPFAAPRAVHTVFDHTSLLKYLAEKWDLGPLGARTAAANSFAGELLSAPRGDAPEEIPAPPAAAPAPVIAAAPPGAGRAGLDSHQSALYAMSQLLESMTDVEPHDAVSRGKRAVTGYDGATDAAIERVDQFLAQQRASAQEKSGG